jgi:septum formation protein
MFQNKNLPIILASQSETRLNLLARINIIPNIILPADLDESEFKGELPRNAAIRLAKAKALHIANNFQNDAIILAADTITACGRRILPKALNREDVKYCINLLSGRRHVTYSSVCVIKKLKEELIIKQKLVQTTVKLKRLHEKEIEFYCDSNQGINKAGGWSIGGYAESFVEFISGSFSCVQGLPLLETRHLLISVGAII